MAKAIDAERSRQMAVTLSDMGDALMAQRDFNGALASFNEGLALLREVSADDPNDAGKQRDVMIAHNRIGIVSLAKGDASGAEAAYKEGLQIARSLIAGDPRGGGRHYDLMVSLDGLATALLAKADAKGAANALRESVPITRQFAEHHSQDANWQDMLAVAYDKYGDALALCNDTEQSLGMYASAMKILDDLSAKEPSNTERSMSVHGNANKIGDVLMARGDLKTAAALYGKGLQIAKTLHDEVLPKLSFAEQVRRGPEIEGGYAVSLEKFGDLRMKEGSNKQAATFYGMSYDGYRSLVGKQPDDPRWETRATKVAEKATKAGGDPGREAALRARLIGDEPTSLAEEKAKGQAVVNEMRQFGVGDRVRHVTARLTGTVKSVGGGVILVDLDPTPDRPRGTVGQYDHFWFSEHPNTLVKVPGAPGIDVAERTGAVDSGGGPQPFRTDMKANHPDEQTITLEGENGEAYTCRILGVFELDGREYALLLKLGNQASVGDDKEDDSTVIMRLVQQGDQAIFRTIENDEEFERVVAYVKALADEKSE